MTKFRKSLTAGILAMTCTISAIGTIPTSHAEETEPYDPTLYMDPNGVEFINYDSTCYFSDPNGNIFEFNKIYSISKDLKDTQFISTKAFAKGVICRPYTGEEKPFFVMDCSKDLSAFDTEGTFQYEGQEYSYELIPPSMMAYSFGNMIMKTIVHTIPLNAAFIAEFDYNKDGQINIFDAVLYNQRYSATPFIHVTNLSFDEWTHEYMSKEEFFNILDEKYKNGEEEIRICFNENVAIPTVEYIGDSVETANNATDVNTEVEFTEVEMAEATMSTFSAKAPRLEANNIEAPQTDSTENCVVKIESILGGFERITSMVTAFFERFIYI